MRLTPNRTVVELKWIYKKNADWIWQISQSYRGGIEIYNWAYIVRKAANSQSYRGGIEILLFLFRKNSSLSPNRTVVELKLFNESVRFDFILLPIVPWWNWNANIKDTGSEVATLPIVPWWNWNSLQQQYQHTWCWLPIVPWWNWNLQVC